MSNVSMKVAAQLMLDNVVTLLCRFPGYDKKYYTYLCDAELASTLRIGDYVIVPVGAEKFKGVEVLHIDDDIDIDLDADVEQYRWAIQRINTEYLEQLEARDERNAETLRLQRRKNLRDRLIEQMTLSLPEGVNSMNTETTNANNDSRSE